MMAQDDDVIGSRPKRDELADLPLFGTPAPARAEQEIRDAFVAPPRKPPRRTASAVPDDGDRHPFLSERERDRKEGIEKIKQLVLAGLLERARVRRDRFECPGITADDVVEIGRESAYAALLGAGQRAWSWVGPWLAQLAREGLLAEFQLNDQPVLRRSTRPESHGNRQGVYLDPQDQRARRVA